MECLISKLENAAHRGDKELTIFYCMQMKKIKEISKEEKERIEKQALAICKEKIAKKILKKMEIY